MDTTLPLFLDMFLATKQTEGKSSQTIVWYRKRLKHLIKFLGEEAKLADVTLNNVRAFIAYLQGKTTRYEDHPMSHPLEGGLSPFTIHGYVRSVKAFTSWLYEEGHIRLNPLLKLRRPSLPKTMIDILTDEEIERLVNSFNPNTMLGSRILVTTLLFLDTGIRAGELLGIKIGDIDWDSNTIKVTGKGSKQRIVAFDALTGKYLRRYLNTFRPEPATTQVENVILSVNGTILTYDALAHLVKRAGESVSIPRLHPHLFRHTFAVKYLMNGGDVMTLKLILGHTSLDVTQVYMHLAESHVKIQQQRFSPVARIKISHRKRG